METEINSARMLLVSRDPSILRCLSKVGQANAWKMETAQSGLEALDCVQSTTSPDLVLLDLLPDDTESLHTLRWLRRVCPKIPVILLSESENHQDMLEALRLGAQDFLLKPCEEQELNRVLKTHLTAAHHEMHMASTEVERVTDSLSFVAASPAMKKLRAQAELLAQVNVPVLIAGEKGSGKTTTAHLIHELSVRSGTRFLKIRCDVLSNDQLEKELFGEQADTVNGDGLHRSGKFGLCHGGTLLLEEVSEMSASLQTRVANALQRSRGVRQNNDRADLDVRILGTIATELDPSVVYKDINAELLRRLSAFTIHVPPLRQRKEDVPILLDHFMKRFARHYGLPARTFSPEAVASCQQYAWLGNLVELENFVKGYLMLGDDSLLMVRENALIGKSSHPEFEQAIRNRLESLKHDQTDGNGPESIPVTSVEVASLKSLLRTVKEETERTAIAGALERTRWNRKAAARALKISYRALLYKIHEYHMAPPADPLSNHAGN